MALKEPPFSIGIEEEYLLVDRESYALARAPDRLMNDCKAELEGQVSPEFLQCQIEIGTRVCANVSEAREDLKRLRATVAKHAKTYGLAPIAASCHPFADWKEQHHVDKDRYNDLKRDLAGVVRRMLICGMHVHVGIPDPDTRIDLVNQLRYFLPHLLALSGSSPFWQGDDTGLASYRLTVFDNLPRTGLPPHLSGWSEFDRSVQALVDIGVIEDSSKIWWDLRPSSRFPTIESRICDVQPRLEHTIGLAALTQCLARMLWRLKAKNQRWRLYDNFLVAENRWRAQRYGIAGGLIDFGIGEIVEFPQLLEDMFLLIEQDAEALGCTIEVEATRGVLETGISADRQRAVYHDSIQAEKPKEYALQDVVRHLIEEYHADL
ncbi:putative glutamate--cysteine ligase 2 [Aliiroseovarius zhejiangensis]|uniref:Putative glutamate--cysteine ligase 2 n=1 Tax=Aliiroseovarius zhejiangensis TaxID=1632025 RepID=A0ABQ3IXJ3_9RHOB|nr:carboxylate-amine ligase [Aliiroseovarius zhejiangensis]GHE92260.1 putative glutamate--cysteine ligase 2 [Aliiroseovarius zhejiangensis]